MRYIVLLTAAVLAGCVPAKKLEEANARLAQMERDNEQLRKSLESLKSDHEHLMGRMQHAGEVVEALRADTSAKGQRLRTLTARMEELNELYESQVQQNRLLTSRSTAERRALLDSLTAHQERLMQQQKSLDALQADLAQREKKLQELNVLLRQKDSISQALLGTIQRALKGYEKSDLSVEYRNGKVYVSLSEKLLFQSGRTDVDAKGRAALQQLAEVLKKNPDISITVEGHTDNVPLLGTGFMKDNWDLSVLRATSIIRILTEYGLEPRRIIASGRSEYFPVASNATAEGKARNRRTEIILTPKLDELSRLIGGF
ncbi:MAG: OmpA family protein [Chitinophagales bacterium]|nr:OmpA family protein [Chitinophagales bacterium]MDW8393103.1 OmpA family protein [Chitinophagales bacterium]